ncbi:hypothetical protein NPIL_477541 [Nephila pilipes]|uniref:Uncharacterized protein n=1 Tax=Nephila pilipes TaxID=299642 RepID=A0A8X6U793_NEPPI|nr:hypothetical protein NPIL_477541 [Nephila pilipes]
MIRQLVFVDQTSPQRSWVDPCKVCDIFRECKSAKFLPRERTRRALKAYLEQWVSKRRRELKIVSLWNGSFRDGGCSRTKESLRFDSQQMRSTINRPTS